jgi:hypothetical protein
MKKKKFFFFYNLCRGKRKVRHKIWIYEMFALDKFFFQQCFKNGNGNKKCMWNMKMDLFIYPRKIAFGFMFAQILRNSNLKKKINLWHVQLSETHLGFAKPKHKMVLCFMSFILNASNVLQPVKFHRLKNQTKVCKPKLGCLSAFGEFSILKNL